MNDQWVFLTKIEDDREVEIIESLFRSYNIPLLRKYRWAGGFLKVFMGVSSFGIDLYVPASSWEMAKDLLNSQPEESGE